MTTVLGCPQAAKVVSFPSRAWRCNPAAMKTSHFNTSRRTRREIFPDGSQLVRRAGGGCEIIEARPKYEVASYKSPSPRKAKRKRKPF